MDEGDSAGLAAFEKKWICAHPELGMALDFVEPDRRRVRSAFACLIGELEYLAFSILDAEPAMAKLQWWAEEFARIASGDVRHPLSRALARDPAIARMPQARWHAVVVGALAQRDPLPGADIAALLRGYDALYRPLAEIEAELLASAPGAARMPQSIARVRVRARALRDTAALADALRSGRLPLPLDLLARHRLARGDLTTRSPQQIAAVREWLGMLAGEEGDGCEPLTAAIASADRWRARLAALAADPLSALNGALCRVPTRTVFATWRAGRLVRR